MFRILKADKDAYITNKFVDGVQAVSGNTGFAGSLDLFKLYGITTIASGSTSIPQTELSRLLLHFDLNPLRQLIEDKKIDITHPTFKCHLSLKDVYGGQPNPTNFSLNVFPLSASFDEGYGKDTSYYADKDKCNFISASADAQWFIAGCSLSCFSTGSGDYITSSNLLPSTVVSQYFKTGEEDLLVDVTKIISATLVDDLPDSGFRISFEESKELDTHTYFVKRFGSRHSYDERKQPVISVKFDDSISDDSNNFYLDNNSNLFIYNYAYGELLNLTSASLDVTGDSCVILELKTHVSGTGDYSLFFTGSQHNLGMNYLSGVYSAQVNVPLTDQNIKSVFDASGSVKFTPVWSSLDGTVCYVTGSSITALAPERITNRLSPRRYVVNTLGISTEYGSSEDVMLRVNVFDANSPSIIAKRLPIEIPGVVIKKAYYGIRDVSTGEYAIPFDEQYNSTKLSSDSTGMYFSFNTSALVPLREYSVDLLLKIDGMQHKHLDTSTVFRIKKST